MSFVDDCLEYDRDHPEWWELFEKMALQALAERDHYSASFIIADLRWNYQDPAPTNTIAAYYARKFMMWHDQLGFFETTQSKMDEWDEWVNYKASKEDWTAP